MCLIGSLDWHFDQCIGWSTLDHYLTDNWQTSKQCHDRSVHIATNIYIGQYCQRHTNTLPSMHRSLYLTIYWPIYWSANAVSMDCHISRMSDSRMGLNQYIGWYAGRYSIKCWLSNDQYMDHLSVESQSSSINISLWYW